jgi:SAM-dependent methyltransferase
MSPLCESYLTAAQLNQMEPFYPLRAEVCECCFLVQLPEHVAPEEIFREYAYFSSYSDSWVRHARDYTDMIVERFGLHAGSRVVEVASNDGYLLQHFVARGIPVLGIEPALNVAAVAVEKGVPTVTEFFGQTLAQDLVLDGGRADLIIGNNVLAQVPELNDFVAGVKHLLQPEGVATFEFPHLLRLIEGHQFDTIYHEHFSYFSFLTIKRLFAVHGLDVFDVEELPTHGGSLRVFAAHQADCSKPVTSAVELLRKREEAAGLTSIDAYLRFGPRVAETRHRLLEFLLGANRDGRSVAGYGAPGKGNTLLNYCGIRQDLLDYTVDRNPYKQGRFLPGTHIPIFHPDRIRETRPDYVLVLPWNLRDEIVEQLSYARDWGCRFVIPIPTVQIT